MVFVSTFKIDLLTVHNQAIQKIAKHEALYIGFVAKLSDLNFLCTVNQINYIIILEPILYVVIIYTEDSAP